METVIVSATLGFVGGLLLAWVKQRYDRRTALAERRHRIYMMLLDLNQEHFWISSNELRGKETPPELKDEFEARRWKIADELRRADDLKQLPQIMDVLFSLRFRTENERATAISRVIDDLAKDVNPRFVAAARRIEADAEALVAQDMGEEWMRRRRKIQRF